MKAINSFHLIGHLAFFIAGSCLVMNPSFAAGNKIQLGRSSIYVAQPDDWTRFEVSPSEGPALGFGPKFALDTSNESELPFRNEMYAAANLKLYQHEGKSMPPVDEIIAQTGAKDYKVLEFSGRSALEFRYESISVGDSMSTDEHFTGVMSRNFMISRYIAVEGGYLVCELTAFSEIWKSQPSLPDVFNDFCSSITFNN